jgi:hypothetical protein
MSNMASESSRCLSCCTPTALSPRAAMRLNKQNGPARAKTGLCQPGFMTISIAISPPDARRTTVAMIP